MSVMTELGSSFNKAGSISAALNLQKNPYVSFLYGQGVANQQNLYPVLVLRASFQFLSGLDNR